MITREEFTFWLVLILLIDVMIVIANLYVLYLRNRRSQYKKQILPNGTLRIEDDEIRIEVKSSDSTTLLPLAQHIAQRMEVKHEQANDKTRDKGAGGAAQVSP